jgi:proteic killer suppression protein
VEVVFRSKKLKKFYLEHQRACREWGEAIAQKYVQRIDILQEASDMLEIHKLPGLRCHQLKGDREGQHAITLIEPWRLIFTLTGEKKEIICVEEVSKHYGD